jgi:hypothetical protein
MGSLGAADGLDHREGDWLVPQWLGVPMFFSGLSVAANRRLIREAGLTIRQSSVETIREPPDATATFMWVIATKHG